MTVCTSCAQLECARVSRTSTSSTTWSHTCSSFSTEMYSGFPFTIIAIDSGTFCDRMMTFASLSNCSVATPTAGMPCFTNCAVSWTLHDVQDPQLAMPTTAASHSSRTRSSSPGGGAHEVGIEYVRI